MHRNALNCNRKERGQIPTWPLLKKGLQAVMQECGQTAWARESLPACLLQVHYGQKRGRQANCAARHEAEHSSLVCIFLIHSTRGNGYAGTVSVLRGVCIFIVHLLGWQHDEEESHGWKTRNDGTSLNLPACQCIQMGIPKKRGFFKKRIVCVCVI